MATNNRSSNRGKIVDPDNVKKNISVSDLEKIEKEAEEKRSRKHGSQSNFSKQSNNGRGGGKS